MVEVRVNIYCIMKFVVKPWVKGKTIFGITDKENYVYIQINIGIGEVETKLYLIIFQDCDFYT